MKGGRRILQSQEVFAWPFARLFLFSNFHRHRSTLTVAKDMQHIAR
jgi:hypothetical protein